jgi:hypothetical protein
VNDTQPVSRRACAAVACVLRLVQAMRSADVRADAFVFNSALIAYAHTRPPLWKPARQLPRATCNALRRSLALSACERRAARTAWWLSGGCRRALARAARRGVRHRSVVFKLYGSYAAQVFGSYECQRAKVRRRALSLLLESTLT